MKNNEIIITLKFYKDLVSASWSLTLNIDLVIGHKMQRLQYECVSKVKAYFSHLKEIDNFHKINHGKAP